jgi:hypothetical protein
VDHRYHLGIFVLDVDAEAVWNVALYSAVPQIPPTKTATT